MNPNEQEKRLHIEMKKLEVREKRYELNQGLRSKARNDDDRMIIEKLQTLQGLVTSMVADETRNLPGSETIYKPVFEEEELWLLKAKIMELVSRL